MPAALGELLSKIISRQVRSSEVKRDQQRDVEKIEEMLVYYKEDGPTLKKLRKRAEDSGLEDSSEYEQFNELREDYVQAIDKLKNKKEGVSPGTLADLIDEL